MRCKSVQFGLRKSDIKVISKMNVRNDIENGIKNIVAIRCLEMRKILSGMEALILIMYAMLMTEAFLKTTMFQIIWPAHFHEIMVGILLVLVILKNAFIKPDGILARLVTTTLIVCFVIARIYSGYRVLGDIILLMIALKGVSREKILRVFFITVSILLMITVVAAQNGLIENLVYYTAEGKERNSFGVCYPTDFAAYVFWLGLTWVSLKNEKIKFFEIIGIALAGVGLLKWCSARTSALCLFGTAFGTFILRMRMEIPKKKSDKNNFFSKWLCGLPPLVILGSASFSVLLSYFFRWENLWMSKLNDILNMRLAFGRTAFDTYNVKWFGQYIAMLGNGGSSLPDLRGKYFFLDSAWLSMLLCYGIVIFTCMLLMYLFGSYKAMKKKQYFSVLAFMIIAVNAIMEHHLMEICYNPFLFVLLNENLGKDVNKAFDERTGRHKERMNV